MGGACPFGWCECCMMTKCFLLLTVQPSAILQGEYVVHSIVRRIQVRTACNDRRRHFFARAFVDKVYLVVQCDGSSSGPTQGVAHSRVRVAWLHAGEHSMPAAFVDGQRHNSPSRVDDRSCLPEGPARDPPPPPQTLLAEFEVHFHFAWSIEQTSSQANPRAN